MNPKETLAVGDAVTWESQSGGSVKTKSGVVAEVVRPGKYPDRDRFKKLYSGSGVGLSRDHTSYVIIVAGKTSTSSGRQYWPRVTALKSTTNNQ